MSAILPPLAQHPHRVLDRLGAMGSLLCAVHCAALPLVLAVLPAVGATLANPTFEIGFVAFACVLGATSLILGYRRHRVWHALACLVPGVSLLWVGVAIDAAHGSLLAHAAAMATGGSLIAAAHLLNLRLVHRDC